MAEAFPKKITTFLKEHHVITIATCEGSQPWCFNAFYVFDEETQSFIFTSHNDTRHVQEALKNQTVAGSVVLETSNVAKVQGLQFTGNMLLCEGEMETRANKLYIKKFPFATLTPKTLWRIEISSAKMTDNTLGFGKKLTWDR
jgi:hypothetical protein